MSKQMIHRYATALLQILNRSTTGLSQIFFRMGFQKFLLWGSKYFSKIEVNYLGGPNIDIFGPGKLQMGIQFSYDRSHYLTILLQGMTPLPYYTVTWNDPPTLLYCDME